MVIKVLSFADEELVSVCSLVKRFSQIAFSKEVKGITEDFNCVLQV